MTGQCMGSSQGNPVVLHCAWRHYALTCAAPKQLKTDSGSLNKQSQGLFKNGWAPFRQQK